MKNPGVSILESYGVLDKNNKIDLSTKRLGVITHLVHQNQNILRAGIFGSRSDDSRIVDESSDIDLAVILGNYTEEEVAEIDFRINRRYRSITGDDTNIHVSCLNDKINHDNGGEISDSEFRDTVMDQIVMLKCDSN